MELFSSIPNNVFVEIGKYMDWKTLRSISSVSKRFLLLFRIQFQKKYNSQMIQSCLDVSTSKLDSHQSKIICSPLWYFHDFLFGSSLHIQKLPNEENKVLVRLTLKWRSDSRVEEVAYFALNPKQQNDGWVKNHLNIFSFPSPKELDSANQIVNQIGLNKMLEKFSNLSETHNNNDLIVSSITILYNKKTSEIEWELIPKGFECEEETVYQSGEDRRPEFKSMRLYENRIYISNNDSGKTMIFSPESDDPKGWDIVSKDEINFPTLYFLPKLFELAENSNEESEIECNGHFGIIHKFHKAGLMSQFKLLRLIQWTFTYLNENRNFIAERNLSEMSKFFKEKKRQF